MWPLCDCLCSARESRGWDLVFTTPTLERVPQRIALNARCTATSLGDKMLAAVLGQLTYNETLCCAEGVVAAGKAPFFLGSEMNQICMNLLHDSPSLCVSFSFSYLPLSLPPSHLALSPSLSPFSSAFFSPLTHCFLPFIRK